MKTLSGREIEPPTQVATKTKQGGKKNHLSVMRWLCEHARTEARQDDYKWNLFNRMDHTRLTPAEVTLLNIHIFGVESIAFTSET